MEFTTQKAIAERIGVSPSYLNDIIKGRRSCSKRIAVLLEQVTGVSRVVFLYPNENKESNPFMKSNLNN